jgi:hypothetical protein
MVRCLTGFCGRIAGGRKTGRIAQAISRPPYTADNVSREYGLECFEDRSWCGAS